MFEILNKKALTVDICIFCISIKEVSVKKTMELCTILMVIRVLKFLMWCKFALAQNSIHFKDQYLNSIANAPLLITTQVLEFPIVYML